jgi:uncharacterized protein YjdB
MSIIIVRRAPLLITVVVSLIAGLSCGGGGDVTAPTAVATVTIAPAVATIAPTETVQLTASAKDAAGNTLADREVTWSTTDAAVATVSQAGLVSGVAEGSARIMATSEDKAGEAEITVRTPVASVEVTPSAETILNGEELQLTAAAKDAAGNTLSDRALTWSSSAPAVASVTSSGNVTGIAPGTATIMANTEGKSGTASITVAVLNVAGGWTFSETFSDPAINLTCNNQATFTLAQSGATFTGTSDQTGDCTLDNEPFDNSGTFGITEGSVQSTAIAFTEPGQVQCVYQGTLVDNPPTSASGTVSCTGLLDLFGPEVNATGTWEMTR